MLTKEKVRCPYCNRTQFFYVTLWKNTTHGALYTECPKCHKFDDVIWFPIGELEKKVVELTGKEVFKKK